MTIAKMTKACAFAAWAVMAAVPAGAAAQQLAQGSTCSSFQAMCANRCRERAPQDANCVADHCTPKLMTCKRDGCWQEGRLYGGKKTCGLAKS